MQCEIILIPDENFTRAGQFERLNKRTKPSFISTPPAKNENYAHYAWWKLKLAAESLNKDVVAYSHMNHLPLVYPMADVLFLSQRKDYVKRMYQNQCDTFAPTYNHRNLPNEVDCDSVGVVTRHKPTALKYEMQKALRKITLQQLVERYSKPKLYIRQSTYDLFHTLDLPENVIMCELRQDAKNHWHGQAQRQMRELKSEFGRPVMGIDQKWQRKLISEVGDHWLGIQVLGSLLKDWLYVCVGGSANLHTLLPTRCLFLKDQALRCKGIVRSIEIKRNGEAGKLLPIVGDQFYRKDEIRERLPEITEGIKLLKKPEIQLKKA